MMPGGPFRRRGRLFGPPPPPEPLTLGTSSESDLEDLYKQPFFQWLVSPYPWTISAITLAGLCGISLCILSSRVRSLDRLR